MPMHLEALSIEPLEVRHAAEMFEALQDPRLYPFIPEKPPLTLDRLEAGFRDFCAGPPSGSGEVWLNWVIRDRASGECIGTLQATRFASGELWAGYKVMPPWWGRGVGTSGLRWLLHELHLRFPGVPVLASVDTRNVASIRLIEKCGFEWQREEAAQLHGHATRDHIYRVGPGCGAGCG